MDSIEYRVQAGDTLSAIARRHGVTVDVLTRLNGLSDVNRIWAGGVLRIPRVRQATPAPSLQPLTYRVRAGDTLSELARHHDVPVHVLAKANGIDDANRIMIGQVLLIPRTGSSAENPKPTTPAPTPKSPPKAPAQKDPNGGSDAKVGEKTRDDKDVGKPGPGGISQAVWDQLELREGRLKDHQHVYLDSEGLPTAGLGHLLTKSERARYKVKDKVPLPVLEAWAKADVKKAYDAALSQAATAKVGNQGFINALACVNFQLGTGWYTEHKKTWAYILKHQWGDASKEAADSDWYRQTPKRVEDFQAALLAMKGVSVQPVTGPPADKAAPGPNLKGIAYNVHEAMRGAGTDEERLCAQLARLNHDPALIAQFKALYQKLYGVDVVAEIRSELSNTLVFGNELNRALGYLQPKSKPVPKEDKGNQAPASPGKTTSSGPAKTMKSGAAWYDYFPTSKSTEELAEPFRGHVDQFFAAMKAAGASVKISATRRPKERAYLMHWSYMIVRHKTEPKNIPPMAGVNIDWDHGDMKATIAAAREMTTKYEVDTTKDVAPSLTSHHIRGTAIDMTISWSGSLTIKKADGTSVTIKSTPRNGTNKELIAVGASYKVIHYTKVNSDPPHWSINGG